MGEKPQLSLKELLNPLEAEPGTQADVAAGKRREILEHAGRAPRIDVEQIVALKRKRQLRVCGEGMPIERCVHERVARRVGFVRSCPIMVKRVFDFEPTVY